MRTVICSLLIATILHGANTFAQPGVLDSTFGHNGVGQLCPPGNSGNSIVTRPDGKIVVGGESVNTRFFLAQYKSDGMLDNSFGTNGTVEIRIANGSNQGGYLALQS